MEEHPQEVKIYKDAELVASASHVRKVRVPLPWKDIKGSPQGTDVPTIWTCFHLPLVKLERMIVFRVLNGQPLSDFFNGAGIDVEQERVEPVFYIHGRVETFRGETTVSAVALGQPDQQANVRDIASRLPELYKRFSAML